MKKILLGLTAFLFVLGCDDGDATVDNINFEDVTTQKCSINNLLYKLNGNEALVLEINDFASAFANDVTPTDTPREVTINGTTNRVIYRSYNGTVAGTSICGTIPDANPAVTEEWKAVSGTIQITSTAVKTTNATTNATKITGYNHYIAFKNITFQKTNGTQVYETFIFGNYVTTATALPFGFDDQVDESTCDNRIFNFSGSEALILNMDATTFANVIQSSVTSTPRTALLSDTNTFTYKLFSSTVSDTYFCTTPTPATPTITQEWNALNGIATTSGIIEVTTTTLGTQFLHTIHLKGVTLKKGNSDFYLGDDYLFGSFVTD